jgi:hypothetical protein
MTIILFIPAIAQTLAGDFYFVSDLTHIAVGRLTEKGKSKKLKGKRKMN